MTAPTRARILVVDDTPANLSLLLDALTDANHEVLIAESGRSALTLLEHTTPDLVLLDMVMPGMDGVATCRRIRAKPSGAEIPILFMTAVDEPEHKLRAFDAGAFDYITKPVYPPEVLARVTTHLQLRALRKSLEDELALRIEAENQLKQSLDRAVVLVDATRRIVFSTRLAEDLLHKYFAAVPRSHLPSDADLERVFSVRRLSEAGRDDLLTFVLAERGDPPGPAVLMKLGITPREAEVLYWVAQGKSNPDVATILGASVRTVHKHVEHIFEKLGVETRNAATVVALELLRPIGT
jgi:DNA-binding response OmpR family regulator/DNA-binding CsgD family transcriptional regulator